MTEPRAEYTANQAPRLSPREQQVLQMAAEGMTYEQIACILNISMRSVNKYLYRSRAKLGTDSTVEAVLVAFVLGFVTIKRHGDTFRYQGYC